MTTIKTRKLARVSQHAVLVANQAEGKILAQEAAGRYRRTFYVLKDDYNGLVRVSPHNDTPWDDELLLTVKAPVMADPRVLTARRADGQHFDQRSMHRGKVRSSEWRREHGLK